MCLCAVASGQEHVMSINQVLQIADSSAVSIQSARMASEAAQAELEASERAALPDVSVSLSASYLGDGYVTERNFSGGFSVPIPSFGNNFSFEASQLIYGGGAVRAAQGMAAGSAKVSQAELESTRQELFFTLCSAMLDLYRTDGAIEVFENNIELATNVLEGLQARLETGAALENDITRYVLYIENLKLQKEKLLNVRQIVNNQLTTTLQLPRQERIVPDVEVHESTSQLSSSPLPSSIDFSPVLGKMDALVSISQAKVKMEKSALLPKVALYAGAVLEGPIVVEIPPLNNNMLYWSVGVSLKYDFAPLWKSRDKIKASTLNYSSMLSARQNTAEQLTNAFDAANISITEADREIEVAESSLELAKKNYRVVSERYENGLAIMTDMLDAASIVLQTELDLRNAQAQKLQSMYKLQYLCGTLTY